MVVLKAARGDLLSKTLTWELMVGLTEHVSVFIGLA